VFSEAGPGEYRDLQMDGLRGCRDRSVRLGLGQRQCNGSAADHRRSLRDRPADGPVGHHRLRADDQRPPIAHGPALGPCGPAAGLHGGLRALRRRRSPLGAGDERLRPTRATGPDGRRGRHDPGDCHGHRHLGVSGLRAWQGPGASDERGRLRGHGRTGAWRDDREPGGLAWRLRCHGHSGHCRDGGRLLRAAAGRAQGATGRALRVRLGRRGAFVTDTSRTRIHGHARPQRRLDLRAHRRLHHRPARSARPVPGSGAQSAGPDARRQDVPRPGSRPGTCPSLEPRRYDSSCRSTFREYAGSTRVRSDC